MTNILSFSTDDLRLMLKGIRIETGSLVSFRDAPAFEMVMRLNQRHKGKLVSAILKKNDTSDIGEYNFISKKAKKEVKYDTLGGTIGSEETRLVFVPQTYEAFLENEMQKWLDPFRGRNENIKRKRSQDDKEDCISDDDDIIEYNLDEEMDYSSASSN